MNLLRLLNSLFLLPVGKYKLIFLCYCDPLGKRKIRLCAVRGNKS